jgi:hypothetical protein
MIAAALAAGILAGGAAAQGAALAVEAGGGVWLADFREHLDRDGAYPCTPALDFSAFIPIGGHFGIEALIGSACVIHRYSKPIDGSFVYQQAGLYTGLSLGPCYAWVAAEAGFEHGTLLVAQYSSGVAGAALGVRVPMGERLSWTATIRFRRGFLQAVTIPAFYGTDLIDHPTILTVSVGVAYDIQP